jgi:hypothetical protein
MRVDLNQRRFIARNAGLAKTAPGPDYRPMAAAKGVPNGSSAAATTIVRFARGGAFNRHGAWIAGVGMVGAAVAGVRQRECKTPC